MSSLKKRATFGMVISMVCLLAGIVLLHFERDSFGHAIEGNFAEIGKKSDEDLVIKMLAGGFPLAAGFMLIVLSFFLFPVFLATWIRNPPPGSKLTFHGWKTPEERSATDLARDEAWKSILWGLMASQSWILLIIFGGHRVLLSHAFLSVKILTPLAIIYIAFYANGIRLCRRRDPASVAAAPNSWGFALAINYGGLFVFLGFIGVLLLIRSQA